MCNALCCTFSYRFTSKYFFEHLVSPYFEPTVVITHILSHNQGFISLAKLLDGFNKRIESGGSHSDVQGN